MRAFAAWRDGVRRVACAPSLVVIVWIATTLVSAPLALSLRADIVDALGRSLDADAAARGSSYAWMHEFDAHAAGIASTLRPTIAGFGAVLDNTSALVDAVRRPSAVLAAAGAYVLLWTFLTGGVIDRYIHGRQARQLVAFVRACRTYFFRIVRIEIVVALAYALLFGVVHRAMFADLFPRLVRGVALERTAFLVRASFYAVFVLLLAALNLVFDFAKVRTVAENRRSSLVALAASWQFIRRHPSGAVGLYLLDALSFAVVVAVYSLVAPSAGGVGAMAWAAVVIGQAYIAGRLCVRLLFLASETALFERRDS